MGNGYDGPSQITDVGLGSSKGPIEDLADVGGVSLGFEGDTPPVNAVSPAPSLNEEPSLQLQGVQDYITNGPALNNIPSEGLDFGLGQGPPPKFNSQALQEQKLLIHKAMDMMQSDIPLVKAMASSVIRKVLAHKMVSKLDNDK
tara:strand:+ start:483 stop:914 length:432 start_codon:yes stop_codon:yes gene_type:complete